MTNRSIRPMLAAAAALVLCGAPALAVDNMVSAGAPELGAVRTKIKAADYPGAIADLDAMVRGGVQHADVYNLLGYSLRKTGEVGRAATFYAKALEFDPAHRGALEYQGELFVQTGQIDRAKRNLTILAQLCPQGCEEREDLARSIAQGAAATQ